MERREIIEEILTELTEAKAGHPHWPDDIIHAVSIMNEEAGESIRAALNYVYENETLDDVKKELVQTAAMCFRCLENIELYDANDKIRRNDRIIRG